MGGDEEGGEEGGEQRASGGARSRAKGKSDRPRQPNQYTNRAKAGGVGANSLGLQDGAGGGRGGKDTHAPAKRYRLTDQMKAIMWQLVCLSNECCRIENEKK